MSIFNEVQQLEELTVIGKALIKYAMSLEPGLVFERQDGWWIPSIEKNFIGFQFHWTEMVSITMSMYGSPEEQFKQDDLTIKKGRFNFSKCRLTDENQLMAATVCTWRAHQLFHKERHIETGALILIDQAQPVHQQALLPRAINPNIFDGSHPQLTETSEWFTETRDFIKKSPVKDSSTLS